MISAVVSATDYAGVPISRMSSGACTGVLGKSRPYSPGKVAVLTCNAIATTLPKRPRREIGIDEKLCGNLHDRSTPTVIYH